MANFNLERIRFRWKDVWTADTDYVKDDIVYYSGKAYVCLITHTSDSTNLTTDLEDSSPKWVLMFDGAEWRQDWTTLTYYTPGDIVKFKGYVYQCITAHTSTNLINFQLPADIANWTIVATTYNWLNVWTISTYYDLGDVVRYNGIVYICSTKHQSAPTTAAGLEDDQASWTVVTTADSWNTDWTTSFRYKIKDIIKYGGITYRCIESHTSATTFDLGLEQDQTKWEIVIDGIEYKGDWATLTRYKKNDIVKSGASTWIATSHHTSGSSVREDESNWDIWVPGLEYDRVWVLGSEYDKGDVVLYGGYSYVALQNNVTTVPSVNGIVQDTGDWELLVEGYRHLGAWQGFETYKPGDVVRDEGYLYVAIADNNLVKPDTDDTKWKVLVTGRKWKKEWQDNTEYRLGDIVTYAGTAYLCVLSHLGTESDNRPDLDIENLTDNYWVLLIQGTATNVMITTADLKTHDGTDTVRLPIGNRGSVLKNDSVSVAYEQFDSAPHVFYVSKDGIDDPTTGTTTSAPFKTVNFALQHITNNFSESRYNSRNYETPLLNEQDTTVIFTAINTLAAAGTLSNAPNLSALLQSTNARTGNPYGDIDAGGTITSVDADSARAIRLGEASATMAEALAYQDIVNAINDDPSLYAGESVSFATAEDPIVMPVTETTWPNTTLFIKTGIYEESLPMRIPRNCAVVGDELRSTVIMPAAGFEQSNMFYVNNGSGLRNMTLQGLAGELPPGTGNEFGTRLPTAGAFVSLDPGTGPNDDTVWIINKSPYIQNVTTFGTGCIGMKIDGTLHAQGNKSVTANDFTQVLDDGIGYWANEAGRSELVSVFTYFCYIGYYATNGGVLRATNGNNSYGTFGSRAEGFSISEVPITAIMDNRTEEAQIEIVHTNGNELVAIGYNHAGQEYTTATVEITGTGVDASLTFDEFRNNAISQLRVIDPADSSTPGGINYQYLLNSAQSGDDGQIQLAAADDLGTAAKYIGMRLVIVSGKGIGQYGYISGYNELTKVAVISKESNDTNGWENLYPGRPIETTLDSSTRYSLEPRVIIDSPGWTSTTPGITWPTGFISSGLNDVKFADGVYVAINQNGDSAISSDGTTFTPSTSNLLGNTDAPGGFNKSTQTSSAVYFLYNSAGGTDVVKKYVPGTTAWSTITLPSQDYTHLAANPNNDEHIALIGGTNGWSKFNNDGTVQSNGTFSTISGSTAAGIAYGNSRWVVVQANGGTAYSTDGGSNWTETSAAIVTTGGATWNHIAYGNGRFVVVGVSGSSTAKSAYSFDGITWYYDDTNLGLMTDGNLEKVIYHNGEFLAFEEGPGAKTVARSRDGWSWQWFSDDSTTFTIASGDGIHSSVDGNLWQQDSSTTRIYTSGVTAIARAIIDGSRIQKFNIYDPGANYTSIPGVFVFDNENTIDVLDDPRLASGVLPQPTFANRGESYISASATITGDGFADIYQSGKTVKFKNVSLVPGPGANVVFDSIDDVIYRLTKVVSQTGTAPNIDVTFEISPPLTNQNSPEHEEGIIMRELYSQIRLTGHDFLDIGSGNVNSTRYPDLYLEGVDSLNEPQPFNEVTQFNGGRIFYTSTDQDGNFRVGELFAVEQSTGIVSINADFFELSGLEELSLGAIQLGGTAVVIREFSKEPTFSANSNNIVPTQKAIASYITSRISGGGADAVTNALIAGQIRTSGNTISNTAGLQINIPVSVNMTKGVDGDYLAQMFFTSGK